MYREARQKPRRPGDPPEMPSGNPNPGARAATDRDSTVRAVGRAGGELPPTPAGRTTGAAGSVLGAVSQCTQRRTVANARVPPTADLLRRGAGFGPE